MLARLAAIGIVITLLALLGKGADAKTPSYVIAGGELEPYAYHFFGIIEDPTGQGAQLGLPGPDARRLQPPSELPPLAYDIYPSYGNFAIPYQIANGGPELRYYPSAALLHLRPSNEWYELDRQAIAFLDGVIGEALARKAARELEVGPIAADFRARHLFEMAYHLRPYASDPQSGDAAGSGDNVHAASLRGPDAEALVRHLIETVSSPPLRSGDERPAFSIAYSGSVGHTGYGGILGYYSPPADGRTGRFWHDGYYYDKATPYYETTSSTDAVIARALSAPPPLSTADRDTGVAADSSAAFSAALGATAAGAAIAAAAAVAITVRRARARP